MIEEWKPVKGYEGLYEVSDLGRIRSLDRLLEWVDSLGRATSQIRLGRVLRQQFNKSKGYMTLTLYRDGARKLRYVHQLVAEAFVGGYADGLQVNHIDGDKTNNLAANLEWVTPSENAQHSRDVLGHVGHSRKLTAGQVREIRASSETCRSLAERFGVHPMTVSDVRRRKLYKEVAA